MIDLHTHSLFSDGELVPAEHVRRVEVLGYEAVAITDHAGPSNLDLVVPRMVEAARALNPHTTTKLIPGVELTHVPPPLIAPLADRARRLGACIVVVHGETVVEPVAPGTNQAALEADIDILAHPGFLTPQQAELAARRRILVELSGRKGHSLTNGHVAKTALAAGAALCVNADAHAPGDFLTAETARTVALGAGLEPEVYEAIRAAMADRARQALAALEAFLRASG